MDIAGGYTKAMWDGAAGVRGMGQHLIDWVAEIQIENFSKNFGRRARGYSRRNREALIICFVSILCGLASGRSLSSARLRVHFFVLACHHAALHFSAHGANLIGSVLCHRFHLLERKLSLLSLAATADLLK